MAFIGQRRHCLRTGAISRQQQDHAEYRQWVLPQDYVPYISCCDAQCILRPLF